MPEGESRTARLLSLLSSGADIDAAITPLVAINGPVHNIHFHFSGGRDCGSTQPDFHAAALDEERSRRLIGIRARLRSAPGGVRKMQAYIRREFGKTEPEDLFGADLERLYAWVHSLPQAGA